MTADNPAHSPLIWLVMVLSVFQIAYLYREARKARRLAKGGKVAEAAGVEESAPHQPAGWLYETEL